MACRFPFSLSNVEPSARVFLFTLIGEKGWYPGKYSAKLWQRSLLRAVFSEEPAAIVFARYFPDYPCLFSPITVIERPLPDGSTLERLMETGHASFARSYDLRMILAVTLSCCLSHPCVQEQ